MSLGFWGAAGVLCLLVAGALLRARLATAAALALDLPIYRDQLAEVDRDIARGVLSEAEAARLRTEVSRRLLDASRGQSLDLGRDSQNGAAVIWGAIFAALAGAFGLYIWLGQPEYWDLPLTKRIALADAAYAGRPAQDAAAQPDVQQAADAGFLALIEQLRAAVIARPNDVQGLDLLAKNEAVLGNYNAATMAYAQMIAAKGAQVTATDHLGAASVMIAATGGMVTAQAEEHLNAALELDPKNGMAQYFIGLMFAQTGRPDRSFDLWEPLLRAGPDDAPWIAPIRAMMPQIVASVGVKYSMPDVAQNTLPGPDASDVANAAEMSDTDRMAMISNMVAGLETRLMDQGGSLDEWLRLMNALGVMGAPDRRAAALAVALAAFENDPEAQETLREAAQ